MNERASEKAKEEAMEKAKRQSGGQGRVGFARRSEPLRSSTVLVFIARRALLKAPAAVAPAEDFEGHPPLA